jgi:hypothetical protein
MLAVVFLTLSLLAIVTGWAIVLVVPALALAAFSFSRQTAHSPPELRVIAAGAFFAGLAWALLWVVMLARLTH